MSHQQRIEIDLGAVSHTVLIQAGVLDEFSTLDGLGANGHYVVISDTQVAELYLQWVVNQLAHDHRVDTIVVPAGEKSKSIQQLTRIWDHMSSVNADRQSTVVALGGGVVGDLAGFAAATFARGVPLVQVPTSLLAQVDSSVGGKVGINLAAGKNLVGAFWQPRLVLIDPHVLLSLDEANFLSGLAEVVKYGVILDGELFEFMEDNVRSILSRDFDVLTRIIARCCQLKAQIVMEDEREISGRRAILNYGHTFGHAIENVFGYGVFLHGQAVSIGMHCAAWVAQQLGMVDADFVRRQYELLTALGLPSCVPPGRATELVAAMQRDKKVQHGKLILILPTAIGNVQGVQAPDDKLLLQAFDQTR